jgi:uncharacterized protein YyaL (SSP411 family)
MNQAAYTNHLIHETSPYLQQHAHNPVDWYPWGEEALAKARREDKPILVSIGYSACHWCHVMEHESFEDEAVARVMNELFVCIKIDREERPDLDKIYQTSHQILAQRAGGWPLNMFLTPEDHMPFFGGTYFPKTPKYGMPGFTDILHQIASVYRDRREAIREQNDSLRDIFARLQPEGPAPGMRLGPEMLAQAHAELQRQFDTRFGGFGAAPKFPHPTSLELCLRRWAHSPHDRESLHMAQQSLAAMALGGIYDQVGGGFCRYSVDERWEIPHFEKMLYDNAQLLTVYVDAWKATGDVLFQRVAIETAEWIMREMQAREGGYYSALDADSEGHEGKFYVWSTDELKTLLAPAEWDTVELRFGLKSTPNFEGRWHLNVHAPSADIAKSLSCSEAEVLAHLDSARGKLLGAREKRARPGRDEKILTSWNGLMIKGMAHAGRVLGQPDFVHSAERALDFIRAHLWHEGKLLATHKDGKSHLNAYLDDYVFLMDGVLELLQARFVVADLDFVRTLADTLLDHFEDEGHGGFYFTGDDHEKLVYRPKPTSDDAMPSGNGVAAQVLLRLGHLLGDPHYLDAAERTLEALHRSIQQHPSAHGALLVALEEYLYPPQTIVLRGKPELMKPWLVHIQTHYTPRRLALAIPHDAENLPGVLTERAARSDVTAYLCTGHTCGAPITDAGEFEVMLGKSA